MTAPLVDKQHINAYIPQKPPMVLIDSIMSCEGPSITTGFTIEHDHIFVKDGKLQEAGLIENIAQTAAARAGYEVKQTGSEPLPGFIGAIKDLVILDLPAVGETLETTVHVKMEVMGVTLIEGVCYCKGVKIAACEMKIVIQKSENTHA